MERNKNTGILVALIIFILLTLMLGGYIVYDKLNNKVNSDNTSNNANTAETGEANEEVVESNQVEDSGEYFKKVNYDYTINGKTHKIGFYYSLGDVLEMDRDTGVYYGVYLTIVFDGKILEFTKDLVEEAKTMEDVKSLSIYQDYNLNKVRKIKGTDQDYIVLLFEHASIYGGRINPIIINDSGTLIEKIDLNDGTGARVPNNGHYSNWEEYYLTDDALYFLDMTCGNWTLKENSITVKEYKVTISNNKSTHTQVNIYENAEGAGNAC